MKKIDAPDKTNTVLELPLKNSIIFNVPINGVQSEKLRIAPDGFYVDGVKVEQGATEAFEVYQAMKAFLTATGMWKIR